MKSLKCVLFRVFKAPAGRENEMADENESKAEAPAVIETKHTLIASLQVLAARPNTPTNTRGDRREGFRPSRSLSMTLNGFLCTRDSPCQWVLKTSTSVSTHKRVFVVMLPTLAISPGRHLQAFAPFRIWVKLRRK